MFECLIPLALSGMLTLAVDCIILTDFLRWCMRKSRTMAIPIMAICASFGFLWRSETLLIMLPYMIILLPVLQLGVKIFQGPKNSWAEFRRPYVYVLMISSVPAFAALIILKLISFYF